MEQLHLPTRSLVSKCKRLTRLKLSVATLSDLNLSRPEEYRIVEQICDWERVAYGEGLHRRPESFFPCIEKNRSGFIVARSGKRLLGYADLWQLSPSFYAGLKIGEIDEESLSVSSVLATNDQPSGLWYVGSMICEAEYRKSSGLAGALLFAEICNYLPKFFSMQSRYPASILGVGSSSFGEKLLTKWAFSPVMKSNSAIDHRPRYEKTLFCANDAACFVIRARYAP